MNIKKLVVVVRCLMVIDRVRLVTKSAVALLSEQRSAEFEDNLIKAKAIFANRTAIVPYKYIN